MIVKVSERRLFILILDWILMEATWIMKSNYVTCNWTYEGKWDPRDTEIFVHPVKSLEKRRRDSCKGFVKCIWKVWLEIFFFVEIWWPPFYLVILEILNYQSPYFWPNVGEKTPKKSQNRIFWIFVKILSLGFPGNNLDWKTNTVIEILPSIPYLEKFRFSSYRPEWC